MSVNWLWKNKMGTVTCKQHEQKYKLTVYKGNCLCVLIYHYKEGKKNVYAFNNFFNDVEHLERCIGLRKCSDGTKEDMFKDSWIKWELNTFFKESLKIAERLTKAGYPVKLYYKEIN
jgi:hypothetical protein